MIRTRFFLICSYIFTFNFAFANATDSIPNKYGLYVSSTLSEYNQQVKQSIRNEMVDIHSIIPDMIFDLKYCTKDNFAKQILYPETKTSYIRYPAAMGLMKVQAELKKQNLSLKIWDAYRPYSITEMMWDLIGDDRYVANPKFGSGHNRGIAVDLTIVSLNDKKELDMGTAFDNFTDTAHPDFKFLSETALQNRKLLRSLMEQNGFKVFDTEWWHYYITDGHYEVLDLSFKQLAESAKSKNQH